MEILSLHGQAMEEFDARVHRVPVDRWAAPTPCRSWNVRMLVNHLVTEQLWVVPMLAGASVAEVGATFGGDVLGADPVAAWEQASDAARAAVRGLGDRVDRPEGDLDRTVHLSFGDVPAREYLWELTVDLAVHAWDLAQGAGLDDRLDPPLVDALAPYLNLHAADFAASGLFADPVDVPADADRQTRLLAHVGRDRRHWHHELEV
jgi:uncharacterized protein (TIGR03086 family)